MKEIPLRGKRGAGLVALVDEQDYEFLSQWQWRLAGDGYVRRDVYLRQENGKNKYQVIRMHRLILERMGFDLSNLVGDHKDTNPLNNQRANLRPANAIQNSRNRKTSVNNTTGFKGVVFQKRNQRFQAAIRNGGKKIWLGYFKTPKEAHDAYCAAAKRYHGDFARTN